jgi:hypothetical protein
MTENGRTAILVQVLGLRRPEQKIIGQDYVMTEPFLSIRVARFDFLLEFGPICAQQLAADRGRQIFDMRI